MALPIRRSTDTADTTPSPSPSLATWDPPAELERLNRQLTAYLDLWRNGTNLLDGLFTPPADVEDIDDAYLVDIELPGVRKDDLDIEIAGRRLSVRGERKEKERVGILRRRERTVGRFQYEVTLPGDVEDNGIVANLDGGVLTVRVPKPENARPRRIHVH